MRCRWPTFRRGASQIRDPMSCRMPENKKGVGILLALEPNCSNLGLAFQFNSDYLESLVAQVLRQMLKRRKMPDVSRLRNNIISSAFPSGHVKRAWQSVIMIATNAGCLYISDFSRGPYRMRRGHGQHRLTLSSESCGCPAFSMGIDLRYNARRKATRSVFSDCAN